MHPGAQYKLLRNLTAINKADDAQPRLETLPPDTVITVAAMIQGSMFVQITCGTAMYDVAADDLEEAGELYEQR